MKQIKMGKSIAVQMGAQVALGLGEMSEAV
jgi:hypothetical protein